VIVGALLVAVKTAVTLLSVSMVRVAGLEEPDYAPCQPVKAKPLPGVAVTVAVLPPP